MDGPVVGLVGGSLVGGSLVDGGLVLVSGECGGSLMVEIQCHFYWRFSMGVGNSLLLPAGV